MGLFLEFHYGIQDLSRDYSVYVPSQWETTLHCNVVSHWLGAYTKWSLYMYMQHHILLCYVVLVYVKLEILPTTHHIPKIQISIPPNAMDVNIDSWRTCRQMTGLWNATTFDRDQFTFWWHFGGKFTLLAKYGWEIILIEISKISFHEIQNFIPWNFNSKMFNIGNGIFYEVRWMSLSLMCWVPAAPGHLQLWLCWV